MADSKQSSSVAPAQCAITSCDKPGTQRCAQCQIVSYCGRDCQKADWKQHKAECKQWAALAKQEAAAEDPMKDPELTMRLHQREFRRIILHHGLHKGGKAEELATFLTDASSNQEVTPEQAAEFLSIPVGDAKTLLSWVNVGVRFKEQYMDGVNSDQGSKPVPS